MVEGSLRIQQTTTHDDGFHKFGKGIRRASSPFVLSVDVQRTNTATDLYIFRPNAKAS
jgi:hypothetical protein